MTRSTCMLKERTRTWKVKDEDNRDVFRETWQYDRHQIDKQWKVLVLKSAEDVCGKAKGGSRERKQTWWSTDETQTKLTTKKIELKEWLKIGGNKKLLSITANAETSKTVALDMHEAFGELHDDMETTEVDKTNYRIAKQRAASRKDVEKLHWSELRITTIQWNIYLLEHSYNKIILLHQRHHNRGGEDQGRLIEYSQS